MNGTIEQRRPPRRTVHLLLLTVLLLPFMATACSGTAGEEEAPLLPEGPALIIFYTDN